MKRILLLFFMFVLAMTAVAQRTQKITYQAVVRDAGNRLVVYTPVRVDVTITSSTGSYFESLRDTTNANGLMYVLIGGNPGFEDIDWVEAVIKTVITIDGGESVSDEVTVTAVPLALQASYATNVSPTAPTIVAVYNQIQADSLALANQIAAERAHLDDTLSHYLMQEVQVLSISNDTIYLTGGSFVKLPAGFSGDYNDLIHKPDLTQFVTNVHLNDTLGHYPTIQTLNDTLSHYLMHEEQVLSVSNDTLYLTGGSWVKLPQGFSGDYNDLANKPDLNQYTTNAHLNDTLSHYYTNTKINDTLAHYLRANDLCDSIVKCDIFQNMRDSIQINATNIANNTTSITNNTTNITNNTTNITNITNNIANLQLVDSTLEARIVADSTNLANNYYNKDEINDSLSHYLKEEVQALRISNDTIYLTGGSFVKLPAGFSGDYNDLTNVPTNVSAFNNDAGYLTSYTEVQALRISNDTIYLTGGSFVKLPAGFSGDYNDLTNAPTNVSAFNNDAGYLTSYTEVQALRISNDTIYLTGGSFVKLPAGFSGDYNELINRPNLDQYATNTHLNDTLGHYLQAGDLCDSIVKCGVIQDMRDSILTNATNITNVQTDINNITGNIINLLNVDSVLAAHILSDSVLFYKTDSIILARIIADSTNLANNYYNKDEINDTLSHYLLQEVQALRISNDTIYLTGGSFVKLPAGFSGDYNDLTNAPTKSDLCDSVKPCVTGWISDSTRMVFDTLHSRYTTLKTLSDSLRHYTTLNTLNDTLNHYLMEEVQALRISNDTIYLTGGSFVKLPAGFSGDYNELINRPNLNQYVTNTHLNDTLSHYLQAGDLCDSIVKCGAIQNMHDSIQINTTNISNNTTNITNITNNITSITTDLHAVDSILNARITTDSTALANRIHIDSTALATRMDTLLKHVCDSVQECVTGWISDSTRMIFDTLHGRYTTLKTLHDTLRRYTTTNQIDTLIKKYGYLTSDSSVIVMMRDSIQKVNAHVVADSLAIMDTLHRYYATNDTLNNYYTRYQVDTAKANIRNEIQNGTLTITYGSTVTTFTANQATGDNVSVTIPTPEEQVQADWKETDALKTSYIRNKPNIRDSVNRVVLDSLYAANSAMNKAMDTIARNNIHDSLIVVREKIHTDSTILAHRIDTLLKHVCDSVKPCVTGWMNDTLKAYTTTNKIDTLIQKYGFATNAHLNDTLKAYTTTDKIDTLIRKYGYLTSDSAVIVMMRDSIQKVNAHVSVDSMVLAKRIVADSTILAHRMDTLLKHVCDSVKPCVTELMNDTLKAYTTTNKIDTLIQKYGFATNAHLNDTLRRYTTTNQIDTLIRKYGYLTSDSAVIVMMRDSIQKVNAHVSADSLTLATRIVADSTALAHRMDTLLKHVCDSVKPCVTELMNDTLKAYTTTNKIDTLIQKYGFATNAHLNDTLRRYTTTNQIDTLIRKYGYLTSDSAVIVMMRDSIQKVNAHVSADSLTLATRIVADSTALAHRMDTLLKHVCDSVKPCVTDWMNDTLKAYTTTNKIDTLIQKYGFATNAHLNDTLRRYTTTNQIDTLIRKYGYLTSDSAVIVMMRDSIQKVNAHVSADSMVLAKRIVADSTILAHRMDTLLKHVCDSVKPCVTGWISDTASAIRNSLGDTINYYIGKTDLVIMQGTTTLGTFNANQTGTTVTVVIPTPEDQVKSDWEATTGAAEILHKPNIRDSVNRVVLDSLYAANSAMNKAIDTIARNNIHDSLIVVREKIHTDSTILAHRMDTLLKHVCDSVKPCVTGWMNDTLKAYTTTNKIDTLIQKYGFATNAHLNDTLKVYTTTDKIDTLIRKYGYLTSDSAVIVMMRDSIQKVNAHVSADSMVLAKRIVADSTILAHRMDTLLKHVCDSVKPCVTGWISDTASAIRNSLGDTINYYIGKTDLVIMQGTTTLGTFNANQTGTTVTVVIPTPEDQVKSDWEATTGAAEILHKPNIRDSVNRVVLDSLYAANSAMNKAIDTIARNNIHDSLIVVREKIHIDSTILAHRMDTLLKHVCDSVKPCVTDWMNDTLKAYTTTNKIDTLIQKYGFATNAHLNDTLRRYTTTNQIDTLIRKYGYLTSDSAVIVMMRDSIQKVNAHVSVDSLTLATRIVADSTALAHRMDTLLKHVCDSVKPCVTDWMNDTLKAYTTTNKIDTLIQKYGFATNAHLNDTLRRYTTTNQIDTLIRKYGYLTSDSAVIVMMRDSIQKVNAHVSADSLTLATRIVADSTALAHRMDTLLKHVCDSVKPCVTDWMNDTLKAYTTTNKIDTLIQKYGFATNAHLNDTLRRYTTTNQIDTLIRKYGYLTSDSAVIVMMRDSIQKVNAHVSADSLTLATRIVADSTALAHRMDTLLKHVCDSVKPCVTDWMNDTLKAYTTTNKIDTLIQKYGFATNAHLNDTLRRYTTTNQIDTLIRKYGYLTSDSAVIVMMRDSIQKVNAHVSADSLTLATRIVADSTALAHRMDTLLKHVCDSVKPCVTDWMNDTLKAYTTTNKIDTLIQKYGFATNAHLNDTLRRYTTTNQIDTLIRKYGYLTSDSAVIVMMRDSIQKVNNRLTLDSTALAHRMDTLLKHVCDSVKPCVTGWISDSTRMVFDTLHTHYTSLKTLADSMHRVDVRIKHDSLEVVELYKQAQTALQTLALKEMADSLTLATRMDTVYKHLCDSVMNCDGIKTMQTNITDVTNNLDSSKTNIRNEISSLNTKLQSNIDSTSQHVRGALKDTAAAIRNSIGNGKLTIQYGTDDPVTFNANQKTDTSIIIPVPTAPNDATLTIQKNGTTVGTFTANQAADQTIDITVPTCDSLAECDLIKSILARLDKLERQNDSLAKEIEKLQPALTVNGPQKDTVCYGSTKSVTYTATFHNCSSSDYTLAWKVNGADSSAVTGAVLTLNVENEGSYKVVCIATRSDNTFVTDTVTTIVSVDTKVPSFTVAITGLTVTLSNVTNTATIQWDTDSMPESFTSNTHTYSVADTITITATSERGCTFTKDTVLQPIAPVVTTDSVPASTIAATTAKAYGTVTSDGGIPETKRGMLYSTSSLNLEFGANGVDSVMNGTGKGNYACTLERLVPCTQYYVRAFAYNEVDTVYGAILNFTTPSFTCGNTLYDIDGNDYATLLLGSQCWMKQNLRVSHYANGDTILLSTSTVGTTSPYRYEPDSNLTTYGYLYNWYAAMGGSSSSAANPSGVQGVCPDGWHLPSDAEWTQLTDFVASYDNGVYVCGNDPTNIGKSMVSQQGWPESGVGCNIGNTVATNNSTQFSIPSAGTWDCGGGVGTNGVGYSNNGHAIFLSATENDDPTYSVYCREFYYMESIAEKTAPHKTFGRSVRCVRDCATGHTYLPTVSAVKITNTGGTLSMAANVDADGGAEVTARGVCWSTSPHPTTSSGHTASGSGIGAFSVTPTLAPGATYYVRAYAINSVGTTYGAEITFVMPNRPTVTTAAATDITASTAISGGNVIADGGASVTARGVCWSTSQNPTISNSHTTDGTGTGSFTSNITSLSATTTYYVRAYATNAGGTSYGSQVSFTTTDVLPKVTTSAVSNISGTTDITATCGGNVTDMGLDDVTARGVCWSTSQNPTISDSHTTDGDGTGSFTSNITGLTAGATYYVRAYATNSAGTAYGNQVNFTVPLIDGKSCPGTPTVTDHEGNVYATVLIGTQCWMRENLRTTTSPKTGTYLVNTANRPTSPASASASYGSKVAHWYSNNPTTYGSYGLLYNWCAAMDTANSTNYMEVPTPSNVNGNNDYFSVTLSGNHRGICPAGWHLPSYSEWNTLKTAASNTQNNLLVEGSAWSASATNSTGFTALPAGIFQGSYGTFQAQDRTAFWSCTNGTDRAQQLYMTSGQIKLSLDDKNRGNSVRCIKD